MNKRAGRIGAAGLLWLSVVGAQALESDAPSAAAASADAKRLGTPMVDALGVPTAAADAAPVNGAPIGAATGPAADAEHAATPPKADLALALRTIPQIPHANPDSPYVLGLPITHLAGDSITDQVELRAHRDGVNLIWTGSVQVQQDLAPSYTGVLNEAVLDRDWAGLRWSIGKKVLSWDVGFGFRPLDVVQQENRRALLVYALEGIPGVSAEAYGADSAWTFVLANPGRGSADQPRDDASLAVRYYRRIEGIDSYAVARLSRREEGQAGASGSWVANDNLELHASALYQRRYELSLNALALGAGAAGEFPLSLVDPIATVARENATRALLGATLSSEDGWSVLAEAWYDGTAYAATDWQALRQLSARQLALLGQPGIPAAAIAGNLAYSSSYYLPSNLLRENLLVHASWKIDQFTPALDLLTTPGDGGVVATVSGAYEGNRMRVDLGLRVFAGRAESAYRQLPVNRIFYLGASFFL
jgi:hypothetical protein